jgi:exopolysaccharide biosynthesis polyprenyl glycosylphosphotransferase
MLTKREATLSQLMIVCQVALTLLLFLATQRFFHHQVFSFRTTIIFLSQIALVWSVFMYKLRLGIVFRTNSFLTLISGYAVTVCFGTAIMLVEVASFRNMRHLHSVDYILLFGTLDLGALIIFKTGFYYLMRYLRRVGHNNRNILIVGDISSIPFIDSFIQAKDWGYRIVAIISPDAELESNYDRVLLIDNQNALREYVTLHPIDDIFYCLPVSDKRFNLDQLIKASDEIGVSLHIKQRIGIETQPMPLIKGAILDYDFVTYQTVSDNYLCLKMKEVFGLGISISALILTAPIMAMVAIMIKFNDGGPVFFKQERIGLNGRRFNCYKFRSMVTNAEELRAQLTEKNEADGPAFKIKDDPRITRIGRILRKTSLDEFPQFLNVIKGEMAVVGPRPPLLNEVQHYERAQLRRLSMKPGITCSWQVWGRHHVSFDEWMRMDLEYIDHWSLKLDLKIILATIGVIFKADGQ